MFFGRVKCINFVFVFAYRREICLTSVKSFWHHLLGFSELPHGFKSSSGIDVIGNWSWLVSAGFPSVSKW